MISIYEVGPRDGIQSLKHLVPLEQKVRLIELLSKSGITHIEAGAFVHPKMVPNMADSEEVFAAVKDLPVKLSFLVTNKRGVDRATLVGASLLNIFYSPNDHFNIANYGRPLSEIISEYERALEGIQPRNVRVYISMAFCSEDDEIEKSIRQALIFGEKVVLCDTNGTASPDRVRHILKIAERCCWPQHHIALHLHHGKHLFDNIRVAYDLGVRQFDSSIGGMGGCPFIPGSEANLATEDLVAWCDEMDIECDTAYDSLKPAIALATRIKLPTRRQSIRHRIRKVKAAIRDVISK